MQDYLVTRQVSIERELHGCLGSTSAASLCSAATKLSFSALSGHLHCESSFYSDVSDVGSITSNSSGELTAHYQVARYTLTLYLLSPLLSTVSI